MGEITEAVLDGEICERCGDDISGNVYMVAAICRSCWLKIPKSERVKGPSGLWTHSKTGALKAVFPGESEDDDENEDWSEEGRRTRRRISKQKYRQRERKRLRKQNESK